MPFSDSNISWRSFHSRIWKYPLFLYWVSWFFIVRIHHNLFIHFPVNGHLGNFYFFIDQIFLQLTYAVFKNFFIFLVYYLDRLLEVILPTGMVKVPEILLDIARVPSTLVFYCLIFLWKIYKDAYFPLTCQEYVIKLFLKFCQSDWKIYV